MKLYDCIYERERKHPFICYIESRNNEKKKIINSLVVRNTLRWNNTVEMYRERVLLDISSSNHHEKNFVETFLTFQL